MEGDDRVATMPEGNRTNEQSEIPKVIVKVSVNPNSCQGFFVVPGDYSSHETMEQ